MNTVSLIGHLTRDPESVETKTGSQICNLRVAIDRRAGQEGSIYTDVKVFGKQAGPCGKHLGRGRQVAVSGRLELDEWKSDDGAKRSKLYVIADRVDFLGSNGGGGGGGGGGNRPPRGRG